MQLRLSKRPLSMLPTSRVTPT